MKQERKFKILERAIDEYIKTGEPVASKLLAERSKEKISSATVRNILAELEKEGWLEQPHASSGRIPTIKAYRYYVGATQNDLGDNFTLSDDDHKFLSDAFGDFEEEMTLAGGGVSYALESAAKILAEITDCAVAATLNTAKFSVITRVEAIPAGKRVYAILLVTSNGEVKNKTCRMTFDLSDEQLKFFSDFARENLEGKTVDGLSDEYIEQIGISLGSYMTALGPFVKAICDITSEMRKDKVIFEGETKLITEDKIPKNEIVRIIEQKDDLAEILNSAFSNMTIKIGGESTKSSKKELVFVAENTGLITSAFEKDGQIAGGFGIIGPVRLDYKKVIPYVEYFTSRLNEFLADDEDGF